MNTPTICAIVLDYYGAQRTKNCLLSLIDQGLTTVYILDNSRNREAIDTLQQVVDQVRACRADFKVKLLSTGQNLGFAKGVNYVIAHDKQTAAPHDYFLLLNNDAVAGPGLVHGLLNTLQRQPDIVVASPKVISSDSGREKGIWYHRYLGLLLSRPGRFSFHYFTGCCLMFHHELIENGDLFDESFFMYGEDTELGWRLYRQGKTTTYASEVFVEHEYGPSVDRSSFFYEYHMARGHLLLSCKTLTHPLEMPILLATKLIGLSARAIVRCFRYRTLMPICSLLVAWLPLRVEDI